MPATCVVSCHKADIRSELANLEIMLWAASLLDQIAGRCNLVGMTPMERAARALCGLDGHPGDGNEGKPSWQSYVPQVCAVLEAIHEPSASMREAGAEVIRYVSPDEVALSHEGDAANVWRFMIDAMRKDISPKP